MFGRATITLGIVAFEQYQYHFLHSFALVQPSFQQVAVSEQKSGSSFLQRAAILALQALY